MALGKFMTSAALPGIDVCPMEGIEPEKTRCDSRSGQRGFGHSRRCHGGYRARTDKLASLKSVLPEGRGPSALLNQLRPSVTNALRTFHWSVSIERFIREQTPSKVGDPSLAQVQ